MFHWFTKLIKNEKIGELKIGESDLRFRLIKFGSIKFETSAATYTNISVVVSDELEQIGLCMFCRSFVDHAS